MRATNKPPDCSLRSNTGKHSLPAGASTIAASVARRRPRGDLPGGWCQEESTPVRLPWACTRLPSQMSTPADNLKRAWFALDGQPSLKTPAPNDTTDVKEEVHEATRRLNIEWMGSVGGNGARGVLTRLGKVNCPRGALGVPCFRDSNNSGRCEHADEIVVSIVPQRKSSPANKGGMHCGPQSFVFE